MPLMDWFITNNHKRHYYIASLPLGGPGWAFVGLEELDLFSLYL